MTDTETDVDELEAQVEEQQQMIEALRTKLVELSQLLPKHDRRQFLKAGAGAGAVLASGAIGRASAAPGDDGDTLWGSASNRDDYYADELDANLVSTDEVDGNVNAQISSITTLRDIGIVNSGQFDETEWDDDAIVAERQ